jgi:hypothetical protein
MAFLYAAPLEARQYREEEFQPVSRVATQRSLQSPTPADLSSPTAGPISRVATNDHAVASTTPRKHMVFPDPVAFR